MISPHFKRLYQNFGDLSYNRLRECLNIQDKIAALIRKERILQYPDGAAFLGIVS